MSQGYSLTPEAQAAIEEICAFVAEDSVEAALHVLEEFERAFERLATTPGIGHTREDLTPRRVRFWGVFSYLVGTTRRPCRSPSSLCCTGRETSSGLLADI